MVEECDHRDAEEASSERELERETNFESRGVGERKKCDNGLFAEKFTTSPKKNGAGIKYENKEKENNSTHDVLRYV
jgi:hypothetical protein